MKRHGLTLSEAVEAFYAGLQPLIILHDEEEQENGQKEIKQGSES